MFLSLFALVLLVAMCLLAGYFIWGQIRNLFTEDRPAAPQLDGDSIIR